MNSHRACCALSLLVKQRISVRIAPRLKQLCVPLACPPLADVPFPKTFKGTVKNIFKRLFRVYAHIYYSHFEKIVELKAEAHLNTCFKHFIYFVLQFDLVEAKELAPLEVRSYACANDDVQVGFVLCSRSDAIVHSHVCALSYLLRRSSSMS